MKNEKVRPWAERIAKLEGSASFKDIREGFGGSAPVLTDNEISMALALSRKRDDLSAAECDLSDVGPEVLETFYGSTQTHRRLIAKAYLRANVPEGVAASQLPSYRLAATLAAQMVAGVEITRTQQAEYAYIANTRLETLRDRIEHAFKWFMERHDKAIPRFVTILKAIVEKRLVKFLMERDEARAERAARYAEHKAKLEKQSAAEVEKAGC
jgi:hypothetical protein